MTGVPAHDYPHQVTVLGTARLPWWGGVNVGAVSRYYSGRAYGRTIVVTGLRQGNERIRVEPNGTYRLPATNQLDLRVEKTWRLGGTRSLGLFADVLNVNNQGTSRTVNEGSGANFGVPTGWVFPRSLRAGGRLTF